MSPSPGSKLFYIYTKKVLSPIEPRPGQPVTPPLRDEVPWNRSRTPLGAPCPDKAGLGWASGAVTGAKLGCPGRFCPPRHPVAHLIALKESLSLALQKALNHIPSGRNPLAFHLLLSGAFFVSAQVFLIIMERGFFAPFSLPLLVITQNLQALIRMAPVTHTCGLSEVSEPPSTLLAQVGPASVLKILPGIFGGMNCGQSLPRRRGSCCTSSQHGCEHRDALGLETYLSARLSSDGHIHHLMLSARYWEEFSFVCNKIILELRNHEPINPGKLCQPSFFEVCFDYLPAMAVNLYLMQLSAFLSGL